ncbi:hypothetical protein W02_06870 [Nitrospira sp. KM1]|uniref:tetratricopeptide repeat protein n=1 Tax=Nitrospira sp. KM1 TaxID=1936990 RepID=UPI0013A76817|nr:tetratricopeptide repeat protein [Nitrospira sp. KM1]BCA53547.1 hypothetical protein W02_06870 [Nitrospira sp. KM1]
MNIMLLQALAVVGIAAALMACGGPEERKAKYLTKAQEYIEVSNYPKARVALRNVLKIDPKDADAYYLFAQVEEREKNWRNAVQLYQEVVELVPNHAPALVTLAKYYLEARLTSHVITTADKVLASHPNHPQALALKIAVKGSEGKVKEAINEAEELSSRFPAEPDVAIMLATLYGVESRFREAEAVLDRALQAHPRDMDLLNNLNSLLLQEKNMAGAERIARKMIEVEPSSFDHRLRLARLLDSQGDTGKAEAILRDAVALEPDNEQRRLILADYLGNRKRISEAERVLVDAASHLPRSTAIRFGLAAHYLANGQHEKARAMYVAVAEEYREKPAGLQAKVDLAELDLRLGKQVDAERQVQEVLKENPRSSEALVLMGRMALARRNGKEAVQAFRTVLHDRPELATVQFLLGQAYQVTGEINLAKESFERAVALYPGQVDARRSLAALDTQSGRHGQARARLEDLLKQRPDDIAALDMLMTLDLMTKNWVEVERTLSKLRNASKNGYAAYWAEGRYREMQGQMDEAARAYERATGLAPNEPEPLLALIKLEVGRGYLDQAGKRLDALLANHPDHAYAHGLLGEVLALGGRHADADTHFQKATSVNPRWITPWLDWAGLWVAQKQPGKAIEVLQVGLRANDSSEELYMLLALAHSEQGQIDNAIGSYDQALRLNPRNVLAANNLAVLLVDHKSDPQSLQKAFALSRDFEKEAPHPAFLDTLGWVRFKMGQQEEALRLIKDAATKLPRAAAINYHLGMAYYRSGRTAEARGYLSKAVQSPDSFYGRKEAEDVLSQMRG